MPSPDNEARFLTFLKPSAGSPDRLRRVDVDRVMSAVPAAEREDFRRWLAAGITMFAVREAVKKWTPDG
jgi:hypothetical protein